METKAKFLTTKQMTLIAILQPLLHSFKSFPVCSSISFPHFPLQIMSCLFCPKVRILSLYLTTARLIFGPIMQAIAIFTRSPGIYGNTPTPSPATNPIFNCIESQIVPKR